MKVDLFIFVFALWIRSIDGQFTVVQQVPNNTMQLTNKQFSIQISQQVNRPSTSSLIRFIINSNRTVLTLDVSSNSTVNVTYTNTTLTFIIPDPVPWNVTDRLSIYFDEGVLYSNTSTKSVAQNSTTFWTITIIDVSTTTTTTTTTMSQVTGSAMTSMFMDTTGYPVTSMMVTGEPNSNNTSSNSSSTMLVGESSPTRSAQWGMGLGITFISLIVIGEIVYFKYCYNDYGRSGSYYT